MVLDTANWIEGWILAIIWNWFLSILMSLIVGSIGVQFGWILFV
jgi:hypothetical protein